MVIILILVIILVWWNPMSCVQLVWCPFSFFSYFKSSLFFLGLTFKNDEAPYFRIVGVLACLCELHFARLTRVRLRRVKFRSTALAIRAGWGLMEGHVPSASQASTRAKLDLLSAAAARQARAHQHRVRLFPTAPATLAFLGRMDSAEYGFGRLHLQVWLVGP